MVFSPDNDNPALPVTRIAMFGFLKKKDETPVPEEKKPSWTERLKAGLAKTRAQFGGQLTGLFRRAKIDDELLEELESTLLMADCGVDATQWLLDELKARVKQHKLETPEQLRQVLIELLTGLLAPLEQPLDVSTHQPFVIMIAGVNGAGKTTSIGKLAKHFQNQGKSVLLAAGDPFMVTVPSSSMSMPRALAAAMASKMTAAGSPDCCAMTITLLRSPQVCNCSRAAARKVSPAASRTDRPCP